MNLPKIQTLSLTAPKHIHYRCFFSLVILFLLNACNGNNSSKGKLAEDSTKAKIEKTSNLNIPNTLLNFDKTYSGSFSDGLAYHLNLRRYGSDISGNLWFKDTGNESIMKGSVETDDKFNLTVYDKKNRAIGTFMGSLNSIDEINGIWTEASSGNKINYQWKILNDHSTLKLNLDDIEVSRNSPDNQRHVRIIYPHLAGIEDQLVSEKVNAAIEYFFESATLKDSVENTKTNFKEDVKYEISYFKGNLISICKHHTLSRNKDTQIFDDSHGININFKRGKIFEIRDIFKPNALDQLNQIIKDRINKSCNGKLDDATLNKCNIDAAESSSFSLSKGKITFHLTERLPYKSRGCGYVRIELRELQDLINPSGPLAAMIISK